MNKISKIISVVLVLIMALSVMVMPASAAVDPKGSFDIEAVYMGKTSGGYDYYRFDLYIDSNYSILSYELNITWDGNVWQKLKPADLKDNNLFNEANFAITTDPDCVMYGGWTEYANNGYFETDQNSDGYIQYPADQTHPSIAKISNTNMGTDLTAAGYTGIQTIWTAEFTDHYVLLSGGEVSGLLTPASGRVKILSWYMRLKDGVAPGTYTVGVHAGQTREGTLNYSFIDTNDSKKVIAAEKGDMPKASVTFNNAAVVVSNGPTITKLGSQIRFNGLETGTKGSAPFDVRTRAQVSKADLAALLGCDVADLKASLKAADIRMGFVYQPSIGSFDLATAKAAAEAGTTQNGYTVKDVKYLGESGDNMVWTCLVTSCAYAGEMTALPYIIYGGEAYFLDTPITCDFSVGYDAKYPSYAA